MPDYIGSSKNTTVIKPVKGWVSLDLKELWEHRELIWFLAWRDILAQYKQTIFGIAWALVKPISQAIIYTLIFGKIAKLSSSGIPYAPFALCGILAWGLFTTTLDGSTRSLVGNSNLITKVYFPRLAIPLSALGRGCVDFIISFILLIGILLWHKIVPGWEFLFFPFFLFLGITITIGIGFSFSAIAVKYRDLARALPFLIQLWFWITPVAYGIENIPQNFKWIFYINPMTWIIQGFRWSIIGTGNMDWGKVIITVIFSFFIFFIGLFYFKKMENDFADII